MEKQNLGLYLQTVLDKAAISITALPARGPITRIVSLGSLDGKNEFGLFHFPTGYAQLFCSFLNIHNFHIRSFELSQIEKR